MLLYSDANCPQSHFARIVVYEKDIDNIEIKTIRPHHANEDLMTINPYGSVPTLVERDLVLYHPRVIAEYLDERYPHPPLMPVEPQARAKIRLALYRVENDFYGLSKELMDVESKGQRAAKKQLRELLIGSAEVFAVKPYFLSDEFTMVDVALSPILWRLPYWGIELPASVNRVIQPYADRLFKRATFQASLTDAERQMQLAK